MSAEPQAGWSRTSGQSTAPGADEVRCLLTVSGEVISFTGPEPTSEFTAAVAALSRDAQRAARHLGLAPWEAVVVESADGILGFAPSGPGGERLAVIGAPAGTPAGAAQRAAIRHAADGARR